MADKASWQGNLTAIQPRIRLTRSFDQRSHTYLGYVLHVEGTIGGEERSFLVGIGKAAHQKHQFQFGDAASGAAVPVADPRTEVAEYYKTSQLKVLSRAENLHFDPPPWLGVPPDLQTYRQRGHRRLESRTYQAKCQRCIWGCRMPVEMIIDQWNPQVRRYRFETFCYGPKSCDSYRAGAIRKVPGRKGMVYEELDWVDDEATGHRGMDD